jgi:hypothetical protein
MAAAASQAMQIAAGKRELRRLARSPIAPAWFQSKSPHYYGGIGEMIQIDPSFILAMRGKVNEAKPLAVNQ